MLDLFSGIGGFHLAASWVWPDLEVVGHCEKDKFCQKVLKKHWPSVPIFDDICNLKGDQFGTVDLITGGFPCQPFSTSGKQRGSKDDRYLWPEMFRIIKESKPTWVVGENIVNIKNMVLDQVLTDLEDTGYETQTFNIPACSVGADHIRERIWVVAHSPKCRLEKVPKQYGKIRGVSFEASNTFSTHSSIKRIYRQANNRINRGAHGVSNRMDRHKSLGNAIVPQVAQRIFWAIKEVDKITSEKGK